MSALSDFLSQPGFWWGVPLGAIVAGTIGPIIASRSVRASDKRKADQEERMDTLKAERENRVSKQKNIREAATALSGVCSSVIEKAIDSKAVFNAIRDAAVTSGGLPDPKELEKIEFATDLMDETKKITTAYNNLRVIAPIPVLQKATALNAAIITLTKATTIPLAKSPIMEQAARALDDFTNAVRAELDLEAYTEEDAGRELTTYVDALKSQVDSYVKESKEEARRLGLLDIGSVEVVPEDSVEIRAPGTVGITEIKAGDLSDADVGKSIGCHDPATGFNYGAKIIEFTRDEQSNRPGVLLRLRHPPIPGGGPEREERVRLPFTQDLEILTF